jgi:ribose transport system substrate-binding protein
VTPRLHTARLRAVATIFTVVLIAASCGSSSSSDSSSKKRAAGTTSTTSSNSPDLSGKSVYFLTAVSNTFAQCLEGGIKAGMAGTGARVVTLSADISASKQQQNVENAIAAKPAAAVLLGIASPLDIGAISAFHDASVPLVYLINEVPPGSSPSAAIAIDTADLTSRSVAALPSKLPGLTKVGYVNGIAGVPTDTAFTTAMADSVKKLGGSYKIVGSAPGAYSETVVPKAAEEIVQKNPDVQVIFFAGSTGVAGAVRALKAAGRSDIKIVVVGAFTKDDYAAIKDGTWAYGMAEAMATIGKEAAAQIRAVLAGRPGTQSIQPAVLVDKKNVASAPVGCL